MCSAQSPDADVDSVRALSIHREKYADNSSTAETLRNLDINLVFPFIRALWACITRANRGVADRHYRWASMTSKARAIKFQEDPILVRAEINRYKRERTCFVSLGGNSNRRHLPVVKGHNVRSREPAGGIVNARCNRHDLL